jgi:hypothetical protein
MDLSNKKIISIGGGCFSNILLTRLNKLTGYDIRVPGPIDNLRSQHGILGSLKLFDKSLEEQLLGKNAKPYIYKKADGKKPYDECDEEFKFEDFVIIHNDWSTDKYKEGLKNRFNNFYDFYEKSKKDGNYLFIYTLCEFDNKSIGELNTIKEHLKKLGILDKTIFIGEEIAKQPVENFELSNQVNWPNFNFENWKKIFEDKYMIIPNSNYYDLAAKTFLEILKTLKY